LLLIVARLRTRHTQYDYKYFVHFSGHRLFADKMEKNSVSGWASVLIIHGVRKLGSNLCNFDVRGTKSTAVARLIC